MKKIIFLLFMAVMAVSCDRDLEFETISVTDPALEILVEGAVVNNTYPKIEGATVELFNKSDQSLATATTDASGKVIFTKAQLKEKGTFKVKVTKGALVGEGQTPYMLLNDGVTLLIITVQ